jgi:hypothetical protein
MAYLRSEKESFEIDYPLEEVWIAIPEAVNTLEWVIQEKDEEKHKLKLKSKAGFMSYSSILYVEVSSTDGNTTKMTINAETPVTTITSIADFGRTRDRVEGFVEALAKIMDKKKKS